MKSSILSLSPTTGGTDISTTLSPPSQAPSQAPNLLVAPDGASFDWFGTSVDHDAGHIVIGAEEDGDLGQSSGSVHVWSTLSGYITKLTAPDGAAADNFGGDVGVSGTTIVVGAPLTDSVFTDSGSTYLFQTNGAHITTIVSPDAHAIDGGNRFGYSVAISGTNVVIGAPGILNIHESVGVVYLYDTAGKFITKWEESFPASECGHSVAIEGTYVAVGCPKSFESSMTSGSAYLHDLNAEATYKLLPSLASPGMEFGYSIALSSEKVIVGARKADGGAADQRGAAYLFRLNGSLERKIQAPDNRADLDACGQSVDISSSLIIVGCPDQDGNQTDSGVSYVFNSWGDYIDTLVPDVEYGSGHFGYDVSVEGTSIIVGAPKYPGRDDLAAAGAAYKYEVNDFPTHSPTIFVSPSEFPTEFPTISVSPSQVPK